MIVSNFYELDMADRILRVYDEHDLSMKEEIFLASRLHSVSSELRTDLRDDSDQISLGKINS